ncbi:MAG: ABC transporter ATP-binding protein, partial [Bacteroidales bacterium]|nr:ABC transporter ATP-binding protein [Bacteroidales bacterium]
SKQLVDIATGDSAMPLGTGIGIFLGILALQLGTILFNNWWESYTQVKSQNLMRKSIFETVMKSRWDGRERFLSGDAVNRLEEDTRVVSDLVVGRFPAIILTLVQLIAASVYLMILAPNLLWVILILTFSMVFGSKLFFKKLRQLMAAVRQRESEIQQLMQESLQNRVLMLTLTSVERVVDKMGWLQSDVEDQTRKRLNYNAVARGLMFFGFQAGHAATLLWGVIGIMHGTITYGMMTAFMQLVGQVQRPVAELGRQIPAIIQAITSVDRVMELMELEQEPDLEPVLLAQAPSIEVSDVTYTYPGTTESVFSNFSCEFPAGKLTVIAGPTGIGKSTLIRLVLGLLKPSSGSVTVGGHPASAALRGNFQYIPQGNSLLSGTIRSNLLLAAPEASEQELRSVLEDAMALFVYDLPSGLDTPCGEDGSGLSEGQCQRIAIARALLRPGGILLLDESTSALDSDTEARLMECLETKYKGRKTIIFVSHRERVLSHADHVVNITL